MPSRASAHDSGLWWAANPFQITEFHRLIYHRLWPALWASTFFCAKCKSKDLTPRFSFEDNLQVGLAPRRILDRDVCVVNDQASDYHKVFIRCFYVQCDVYCAEAQYVFRQKPGRTLHLYTVDTRLPFTDRDISIGNADGDAGRLSAIRFDCLFGNPVEIDGDQRNGNNDDEYAGEK